jgi:hypothetical protein
MVVNVMLHTEKKILNVIPSALNRFLRFPQIVDNWRWLTLVLDSSFIVNLILLQGQVRVLQKHTDEKSSGTVFIGG